MDFREARCLANNGVPLRHLGHLVQIPDGEIESALRCRPEVITVFSFEKARRIAECARRLGMRQRLLLKVCQTGDIVYPGQEGGFLPDELVDVAARIAALGGVEIVGVTNFPCAWRRQRRAKASPRRTLPRWSTRRKRCARRAFLSSRLTPRRPIAATPSLRLPAAARRILNLATRLPAPFRPMNTAINRNASPCCICRKCLITQDRTACASAAAITAAAAYGTRWFSPGIPPARRGHCRSNRTISITTGAGGQFRGWQPGNHVFPHADLRHPQRRSAYPGISAGRPTLAGLYDSLGNPIVSRQ